ncbi:MAG: O-antigen ligase family protein, partial [Anaerolineae bacterium]
MHTRISQAADKMMEAIVLVAALSIPAFFNPYSARVFEGEKVSLLRALAAIAATAWLIRHLEGRGSGWLPSSFYLRKQPVILAALLTGLVTTIAGFTSITPRLTLWGSYQRGQGTITTLGYLVLFFATVTTFANPDRRRRLVTALLVASGPVAIFAIIQYAGLNPVPWRSLDPSRVFGTLSNPIFLGAYLVMVIPLTLAQIARCRFATQGVRWSGLSAYVLLLVLQLAAAVFSGSRGPLIGIVAGVFLFVFLLALLSWRRRFAAGLLSILVLGLVFLIVFSLPNTPLAQLRDVPVLERFGQGLGGGSGRVRVLIWQGVVERFAGEPTRLALGYGPESTHAALLATFQPELRHLEPERLPDRAHNVFLEALVTTGLVGAASVVLLFAALFYTGLRALGWMSSARSRSQWLALTAAGIALGLVVPRLVEGNWTFAGVGVGLGLTASLGVYLVLCLWRSGPGGGPALSDRSILVAGILAALAGHLVEITVGIRVTATESLFWVLAGLLVTLSISDFGFRIVEEKSEIRNP